MNPLLVFWVPQIHFPLSGSVAQRIDLFDSIMSSAGDSEIEREAIDVASYGRQLGWISEVLLDIAAQTRPKTEKGKKSLGDLRVINDKIEALNTQVAAELVREIERLVSRLKRNHKDRLALLRNRFALTFADEKA